jgi:hypothetical protein
MKSMFACLVADFSSAQPVPKVICHEMPTVYDVGHVCSIHRASGNLREIFDAFR